MKDWPEHLFIASILTMLVVFLFTDAKAADSTSNINYKNQPPSTAISPGLSIGSGNDVCIVVRSGAIGTSLFNASAGIHVRDKVCERIKLSRSLAQLGLKVSATSILCQDPRVFTAMLAAGSPCPIDGLVGKAAKDKYIELGIIDDKNNIVDLSSVLPINVSKPSRDDYFGQPTN